MSFIVLSNSTRVILPLRTKIESPTLRPVLKGLLISQAKMGGHCQQSFIALDKPGIPRPFRGDQWCYDWRVDGENTLACWVGFPNNFFSTALEPHHHVAVEVLGFLNPQDKKLRSLSRIEITLKPSGEVIRSRDSATWMPETLPREYPTF